MSSCSGSPISNQSKFLQDHDNCHRDFSPAQVRLQSESEPENVSIQDHSKESTNVHQNDHENTPRYRMTASAETERIEAILQGFTINFMNIRDERTGRLLWQKNDWQHAFSEETQITLPKEMLQLPSITREMNFTSKEAMSAFRLVQHVCLHGQPIEQWTFEFGFVIPGSTNSWQCVIEADSEHVLPVEVLNGNVTIVTSFYDSDMLILRTVLRVYYE